MAKATPYHHGDLRRVLLDASLQLVDEGGVGALSLRQVARKAGVSHNAPYHHFPDKASLMAAIAVEGFTALAADMVAARADAADDPLARMQACGTSYVRFALRSPAHFRVMFRPELASIDDFPAVFQASTGAFDLLVSGIVEAQAAGKIPPGDPMPYVLTCWSAVHGLASLWLDGPLSRDPKGFGRSPDKVAGIVVSTMTSLLSRAAVPAGRPRRRGARLAAEAHRPPPKREGGTRAGGTTRRITASRKS